MHVRVPGRIVAVVPNALQVVGHRESTSAGRDAEVSTKVEVELFEEQAIGGVAIVGRCAVEVHQILGVALRSRTFEMESHATHIRLVVGDVSRFDSFKRLLRSVVHEGGDACVEIFGSAFGALGEGGVERRATSQDNHHFFSALHHDTFGSSRHCTAHRHHFEACVVEDGGQFSGKPARTIGSVFRFGRHQGVACNERELKVELVGAHSFVECCNHSVGL